MQPDAPPPPPLSGRQAELDRLTATMALAVAGRGRALFIKGPLGIGKSRLLRALRDHAEAQGFLVLAGSAGPLDHSLAYAVILDALGRFLHGLAQAGRAALLTGLPELGRLFPGLGLSVPADLHDPALEKTRLFEAVTRLLERLAEQQPVLLVLDDLHWADGPALELTQYLCRGLADRRTMVCAALRSDEADRGPALPAMLQALERAGLAETLRLGRLPVQGVAEQVTAALGGRPPAELLDLLAARAQGNPLLVAGLVRALIETGALRLSRGGWLLQPGTTVTLPDSLAELAAGRLQALSPPDRRIVDVLAACGEPAPYAVLARTLPQGEDDLLAALARLQATGLITEATAGAEVSYGLAHPLMQEVAAAALPAVARQRLHARLAAVWEELSPAAVQRLAHHYRQGGPAVETGRALDVILAAGEQSRSVYAHDAAVRHFTAALERIRHGGRRDLLPTVLTQLGEVLAVLGEGDAAVVLWQDALTEIDRSRSRDGGRAARLQRLIALTELERGRNEAALERIALARAALEPAAGVAERAELLLAELVVRDRTGDLAGAKVVAQELANLAEQGAGVRLRAQSLMARGLIHRLEGDLQQARACCREGATTAAAAGDLGLAFQLGHWETWMLLEQGDLAGGAQAATRSLHLARRLNSPIQELEALGALITARGLGAAWDEALDRTDRALALAYRVDAPDRAASVLASRCCLLAWRGELAAAAADLSAALAATQARLVRISTHIMVAMAAAALAAEEGTTSHLAAPAPDLAARQGSGMHLDLIFAAEAQVATGQVEAGLALAQKVVAATTPQAAVIHACGRYVKGLARKAQGQPEQARALFAAAGRDFTRLGMRFHAARASLCWAAATASLDRDAALAAARQALDEFDRLQARRYADQARQVLAELGVRLPSRLAGRGVLSPREWEVAELVAQGLTNAEIAARLVVSPRTVTTHLSRIYNRLGFSSRDELIRYATNT